MQKVVVITGGSSGIGKSTVELFLGNNCFVYNLDTLRSEIQNKQYQFISCDVSQVSEIESAVDQIKKEKNRIDILISNAGIHFSATIENTTEKDFDRVVGINLKGCFFMVRTIIPVMKKQKSGSIVLLGSDQSFVGKPNSAVYGLTKAAISQLAKSTAIDYAKDNIRVNCVCAGTIDTPLYRNAIEEYSKKTGISFETIEKEEAALQPLNCIGTAEEVAELIYFLSGEKASFITGALYAIDGGYTAQ